jgi:hypothetical protein
MIIPRIVTVRTRDSEPLIRKYDAPDIIIQLYMGDFSGPKDMNDICGKTHRGTTDRGFTVSNKGYKRTSLLLLVSTNPLKTERICFI